MSEAVHKITLIRDIEFLFHNINSPNYLPKSILYAHDFACPGDFYEGFTTV